MSFNIMSLDAELVIAHNRLYSDIRDLLCRDRRTYKQIAREANLSAPTIRNWALGITRRPQMLTACKIAYSMQHCLKLVPMTGQAVYSNGELM